MSYKSQLHLFKTIQSLFSAHEVHENYMLTTTSGDAKHRMELDIFIPSLSLGNVSTS